MSPTARKQLRPRDDNSRSGRNRQISPGPQLQIAPGYKSSGLNRSLFCDIRVGEVSRTNYHPCSCGCHLLPQTILKLIVFVTIRNHPDVITLKCDFDFIAHTNSF